MQIGGGILVHRISRVNFACRSVPPPVVNDMSLIMKIPILYALANMKEHIYRNRFNNHYEYGMYKIRMNSIIF